MKKISDTERLEALSVFMDKCNTDLLTKEELIAGIESIIDIRPLSLEAKQLYTDALELIYKGRK